MGEIQLVGVTSPNQLLTPMELRAIADWTIRPRLLNIPGIAQVISIGGGVKQYQIELSALKIQKYQLSIDDIKKHLSNQSKNTTGGFIDIDKKEFLIRNIGIPKNKNDILKTVVGTHLGKPVTMQDIAEIKEDAGAKQGCSYKS
jgi:Cu(I)/Ag(I) efflux system membrane protein CusA/SilA